MEAPRELLEQFVMLTQAEESLASQLLCDHHLDLEAAVSSYFAIQEATDGTQTLPAPPVTTVADEHYHRSNHAALDSQTRGNPVGTVVDVDAAMDSQPNRRQSDVVAPLGTIDPSFTVQNDDRVREPIPQQIDQILPSVQESRHNQLRTRRSAVNNHPFLQSDGSAHGDHLAALYRPPVDMICEEDMEEAMKIGRAQKRWLIVNMQRADVFQCHVLNRDCWSDPAVHDLIQSRFIFWQRDESSDEGARYKRYYPYDEPPHVALIDPRSGERLRVWGGDGNAIKKTVLVNDLVDFSDRYSLDEEEARPLPQPSALRARAATQDRRRSLASSSHAPVERSAITESSNLADQSMMDTEDAQMAAAIAESLRDNLVRNPDQESYAENVLDDDVPDFDEHHTRMRNELNSQVHHPASLNDMERQASRLLSATDPKLNDMRSIRAQQDSEYEESLALDRAKSVSAKEETERLQLADARMKSKRQRLPPVPDVDVPFPTIEIVIRLPSGKRLQRRFLAANTVGDVYDFVDVENGGELAEDSYSLVIPIPRTAFTNRAMRLEETNLSKRVAFVVDLH